MAAEAKIPNGGLLQACGSPKFGMLACRRFALVAASNFDYTHSLSTMVDEFSVKYFSTNCEAY
jgi:hypothetical protein